jgi:chemotaxis protein MotB
MAHGPVRSVLPLLFAASLMLSACAQSSQLDTALADNHRLNQENQQLTQDNQQLRQQVVAEQSHVGRLQEAVKYTVNSDLAFAAGSWQLSAAGKDVIAKMATVLAPQQQEKIMVAGYTDDTPVGAGLRAQGITSNRKLSQKRADTVMQYMISQGVNPDMVTARGLGEDYPLVPNSSAAARAQNRRVEVTLAGPGS